MMDLFEDLLTSAAQKILGAYQLQWQGQDIDLTPGWPRLPMYEAVKQYTGLDFMAMGTDEEAVAAAKSIGVELPETADKTWGNALYEVFDQRVEEKLIQPTFITMHPVDVTPGSPSALSCLSAAARWATPSPSSTTPSTSASASRSRWRCAPAGMTRRA